MSYGNTVFRWRPATVVLALGLLLAPAAGAHPYEDPLKFEPHTHAGGRVIFSNIPKRCFRDGVLICHELHPIFPQPGGTERTRAPNAAPASTQ